MLDLTGTCVLKHRRFRGSGADNMADKDDILLNSREVAFLLDLSPDTVNELARRSILPAFKKGRQWRFRKRDIASFKRHLRGVSAAA
jgi:excisionase family DNA binding protein